MKFEEFVNEIINRLEQKLGLEVQSKEVLKNNGLKLTGACVVSPDSNMSPTIYLNGFYEEYCMGRDMNMIVENIINGYKNSTSTIDFHPSRLMEYEKAKDRIVFKLVNKERNKELLKEVPYIEFLDLVVIFYYLVDDSHQGLASIVIRNEMMDEWGITIEDLNNMAQENAPKLMPARIEKMEDIIRRILFEQEIGKRSEPINDAEKNIIEATINEEMEFQMNGHMETRMYVIGNRKGVFGAASLLYQNLLKEFATKIQDDFYILPSSVHETIAIPAACVSDGMDLKYMVADVNNTQVEPEEVLSNTVYYYESKENKIFEIS